MRSRKEIDTLSALAYARVIADRARELGMVAAESGYRRGICHGGHLGALMADAVLQAGVNYQSVVLPRVRFIVDAYPEAHCLDGMRPLMRSKRLHEFLRWQDDEKPERFRRLFNYFRDNDVIDAAALSTSLSSAKFRQGLLQVSGIGPKTVDYLRCLSGIDCVAVDRHIRTFASESGVEITNYECLSKIFSYAADLLEVGRREFDSWVWTTVSSRQKPAQIAFAF